jgi:putative endopeptidase
MKVNSFVWLAIPAVVAAIHTNKPKPKPVHPHRAFFDKTGMDTTVRPGDNFFQYASGAWMKKTEIPASETGWGSFYTLYNDNQKNLHTTLVNLTKVHSKIGTVQQKVGDFYASGMDTVAIEKLGFDPIKPTLAKIDAIKDYKELIDLVTSGYKTGDGDLFGFGISPDDRISTKYAVNLTQDGINLPNRDYYFKTDAASENIRKEYVKYATKLFTLAGADAATAAKNADDVLKLETTIANSHLTPVQLRDPVANYNKFTVADFQKQVPDIDLKKVLGNLNVKVDTILVGQPKYFKALDSLLKSQPIAVWKEKLKFDQLNGSANSLSKAFRDARFEFFGKTLSGQKVQKERWKTMVSTVDGGLGELLGKLYVDKYFTADAKKRMLDLVNNLQAVYRLRIEKLDWMSPETKTRALAKLDAFTKKIGYPDKWKNYDDVNIDKGTYYKNGEAVAIHNYKQSIAKMGKPVDKTEWGMTTPTVNAYYNPAFNEIVFPAGILQFPFFDKDADDAINYGAIGAVIGHEMTHGFDDQGSQYDKDGNLKNWWTKEDQAKFKSKVKLVIDQYNKYTVLNDLHVNGELTQGENLADIGGLAIAYRAFKNTPQGKGDTKIDGFTPDQRFFLSFGQVWRIKNRDERLRMRIGVDPHSPEMYRVNGPLSNMPEFYKAFNVKPGDKLYRDEADRVKVW